jgi:type-F conjugative transfer system pilin assembly protein TrbC
MKRLLLPLSLLLASIVSKGAYADDITDIINKSEAEGAKAGNEASGLIDDFRKYAAQHSGTAGKMVDSLNQDNRNRSLNGNKTASTSNTGSSASTYKSSYSSQKNFRQKAVKDVPLAHEGKKGCSDQQAQGTGKCASSLFENLKQKNSDSSHLNTQLLIFVSESVPANSIKELWSQAQKVGGKLVIRGLVGGSFKATQQYIQDLGIVADIDPTKFEEFEVTQVPTFVLSKEGNYDKMVGNVSLGEFLGQASANGDLKQEATAIYTKLQGSN